MEFSKLVHEIQYILAPAIMVSSSALLLLGYQNKFSALFNRFRSLNQERRALTQKTKREPIEEERLGNLKAQLGRLKRRATHVKNAILLTYGAIVSFLATSVFLFLNIYMEAALSYLAISFFLTGLICVFAGSVLMIIEVTISFNILQLESKS